MTTLILTILGMAVIMIGMAIGVMMGRKPISGSCGGIGALGIDQSCEICGGDPNRCEVETGPREQTAHGFYDAS